MNASKSLIVLDTNVIISGLLSEEDTYPAKIINSWLLGNIKIVISPDLKQELNQVLKKPYIVDIFHNNKHIKPIIGKLLNKATLIYPKPISKVVFSDKTDHFLLELAITSKSKIIVTGDKQVLNIKKANGIFIMSPKEFCLKFNI